MTRDVVIRTCRSSYRFTALEPTGRLGRLSGGRLGCEARDAMLVGDAELRVGSRAVFDVAAGDGVRRFTTSPIREIGFATYAPASSRTKDDSRGVFA